MRILGVGLNINHPGSKWLPLYSALGSRFDLVGTLEPDLGPADKALVFGRSIHPNPRTWRRRAEFSLAMFRAQTKALERALRHRSDDYDLIVQSQTLFAPGMPSDERPYVVYTDATRALNEAAPYVGAPTTPRYRAARKELEAQVARHAACVFTMSEWARRSFIDDYGCDPRDVVAAGWGTEPVVEHPERSRRKARTALFVGYDFVWKGGDVLLAAWRQVRQQLDDATLIVAGPRTPVSDETGVTWIGRVADRRVLSDLYETASVFVLPTRWEPFGLVVQEAMGHGLPVVATDVCSLGERVHHGSTGLLVPPDDVNALAEGLLSLLTEEDRAAEMGEKGHRWVLANATWPTILDRIAPRLREAGAGSAATRERVM